MFKQLQPRKPSPSKITKIYGFDIETYNNKNEFVLATITEPDEDYYISFTDKEQCWYYITHYSWNKPKQKTSCMVATNLMFDFFGIVPQNNKQWSMVERRGRIYSITIQLHNGGSIIIYDTLNYLRASVQQLGKIINSEKITPPLLMGHRDPTTVQGLRRLETYCLQDSHISASFMKTRILTFCKEWGIPLKSTIGTMSMHTYQTHFLEESFEIESITKHRIAFKAYYGGRTEVFQRGQHHNIDCYDFNSLYPRCMMEQLPDIRYGYEKKTVSEHDIYNHEGACYVEGYQPFVHIPVLPVHDDKLIFPVGHIKGFYTFVELRYALQQGFLLSHIGEGVVYTKSQQFLKPFVEHLYSLRKQQKEHKDGMEIVTKLILNNLYGKFAFNYMSVDTLLTQSQLREQADKIIEANGVTPLGEWFILHYEGCIQPQSYSVPIWSAYITSYARIMLHKAMLQHEKQLVYCDTDSIFIPSTTKIPTDLELGGLKLEDGYPVNKAIFVRAKMYYTQRAKIKGVHKSPSWQEFITLLEEGIWEQKKFCTLRSSLRRKGVQVNEIIDATKHFNVEDTKRCWSQEIFSMDKQISLPWYRTEQGELVNPQLIHACTPHVLATNERTKKIIATNANNIPNT